MRNRLYILAALAILLVSCGKEPAENPGGEPENRTALSFTYKSYTDAATYAALVPAETAEKVIRDMDIFAFYGDGVFLRKLTADSDYTQTVNGENTTVTVSDGFLTEYFGKSLVFYFVANNAASTGGTHIAAFAGTKAQFEELLTTPLADGQQAGKAENITITDNTGGLLMTGKTGEIALIGKRNVPVTLKRRAARFDIENPKPAEYRINEIYVTDAKTQGTIFADGSGTQAIPTRSLDAFSGPAVYNGTVAVCAFYLYSTDLPTTSITMEVEYIGTGTDNGKKMIFKAKGITNPVNIYANTRYTLVLDPTDFSFGIGAGEIEEGDL